MKGYLVEDRLYIFPQTVDVIPEVEGADVIYVQHETVKAWKEANSAIADKIKGYNFFTMTALPKEWAGHTDDDIEPEPGPEPETRSLEVTDALEAILQVWDNDAGANIDPAAVPVGHNIQVNLNDGFTLNKEATEGTIVTISLNDVDISDSHSADEYAYVAFQMPDEDSSLVVEEWIPEVETYTLTLDGTYSEGGSIAVTIDDETPDEQESPYTVPVGATVKFVNTQGTDNEYEWDSQLSQDGDGYYYIVMPAEDVTITINYTALYTLTLTGDNILEYTTVKLDDNSVENTGTFELAEGTYVQIEYISSTGTYNIIQAPDDAQPIQDGNGGIEFSMPAENVDVIIDFVEGNSSSSGAS